MAYQPPRPRKWLWTGAALFLSMLGACVAAAQSSAGPRRLSLEDQEAFPSRAIRIIVPFPPGASTDAIARIIAKPISDAFERPIFVDNRSGAGGNIGAEVALRAPTDGHTWLLSTAGILTINALIYTSMRFDPVTAFAPITLVAHVPYVLNVHPSVPVSSVAALVKFVRRRPDILNYGSAGNGSTVHLGIEMLKAMTGTKIVHVPYRGGAPALKDLIGGHIDLMFNSVPLALPHIGAGRVRPLAVSSATRSAVLPELPTMHEAGVDGFEFTGWFALLVPARTPQRIVRWLNAELSVTLALPETRARLAAIGVQPVTSTPGGVFEHITRDTERWRRVIRTASITSDLMPSAQ